MQDQTVYKAERKAPARRSSAWPALLVGGGLILLSPVLLPGERFWLPLILLVAPALLLLWPAYRSTATARSSVSFLAVAGAIHVAGRRPAVGNGCHPPLRQLGLRLASDSCSSRWRRHVHEAL
jgi:hypothetical protein